MRYHNCGPGYGHGWHCGWGPGPEYDWGAPPWPYPYRQRPGFGLRGVSRRSALSEMEDYLASLREEARAIEQDIRELAASEREVSQD